MVFLELRRDSRVTAANSGCLLCWPREVTITVRVRFTYALEPQYNINNRTFSAFADYDSSKLLQEVEGSLIPEIVEKLVDDIFNAAVSNW